MEWEWKKMGTDGKNSWRKKNLLRKIKQQAEVRRRRERKGEEGRRQNDQIPLITILIFFILLILGNTDNESWLLNLIFDVEIYIKYVKINKTITFPVFINILFIFIIIYILFLSNSWKCPDLFSEIWLTHNNLKIIIN